MDIVSQSKPIYKIIKIGKGYIRMNRGDKIVILKYGSPTIIEVW